ncbi:hypothetical protein ACVDG8_008350 [Mesorhizobium sp. ORM8.1]
MMKTFFGPTCFATKGLWLGGAGLADDPIEQSSFNPLALGELEHKTLGQIAPLTLRHSGLQDQLAEDLAHNVGIVPADANWRSSRSSF